MCVRSVRARTPSRIIRPAPPHQAGPEETCSPASQRHNARTRRRDRAAHHSKRASSASRQPSPPARQGSPPRLPPTTAGRPQPYPPSPSTGCVQNRPRRPGQRQQPRPPPPPPTTPPRETVNPPVPDCQTLTQSMHRQDWTWVRATARFHRHRLSLRRRRAYSAGGVSLVTAAGRPRRYIHKVARTLVPKLKLAPPVNLGDCDREVGGLVFGITPLRRRGVRRSGMRL